MGMINTIVNGQYEIILPKHRAERPQWTSEEGWEKARIDAMIKTIMPNDIVFDIGVEEGDITGILQKYTDCRMVMFEPNDRVWSCIKAIWEANKLKWPLDFFRGFASNKTTVDDYQIDSSIETSLPILSDHGFKQLYEKYPYTPQIKIDDYCKVTGIYPDVITMDVEGSEFEVLKGAEQVLKEKHPIVFLSLHPEFMYEMYKHESSERFGETKQFCVQLLRFVDECGYTHRVIEWDYHECHIMFDPK